MRRWLAAKLFTAAAALDSSVYALAWRNTIVTSETFTASSASGSTFTITGGQ